MTVRFELVTSTSALEQLFPRWTELVATTRVSPFAYPGFFRAWGQAFGATRTPFAIVGKRGGAIEVVLPAWHPRDAHSQWSTLGGFRADYSEAVIAHDDRALATALWRWIERDAPCEVFKVSRVPADRAFGSTAPSPNADHRARIVRAAKTFARTRQLRTVTSTRATEHPYSDRAEIEEHGDRLDAKYMQRNEKMLNKVGGDVSYRLLRGGAITPLLPTFFAMHAANFAGTGRASQFESGEDRAFYEALATDPGLQDVVRMDVLEFADRPAALHVGFHDARWIYYYKPTFDLELGKASPGKLLLAHIFRRARDESIERIDMLKGNESYKTEWGSHARETVTATVVRRHLRELVTRWRRR